MKTYLINLKQNDFYTVLILHPNGLTLYTKDKKYEFKSKKGLLLNKTSFHYHYHDFYDHVRIHLTFSHLIKLPYHTYSGKAQGYFILFDKDFYIENASIYIVENPNYPLFIQAIQDHTLLHIHKNHGIKGYLIVEDIRYCLSLFIPYKDHYRYLNYHLYITIKNTSSYVQTLHLVLLKKDQEVFNLFFEDTFIITKKGLSPLI